MSHEFDPTPPPGIHQQAKREYTQIVSEISQLQQVTDETALEMGDRFHELEIAHGKEAARKGADDAGVTWSVARQRLWVAKRIPQGHKLRAYLTDTHLNFSHLRAIAATENPEEWADKAVEQGWSVAKLVGAINEAGDKKAQEEGDPCIQCNEPLPEVGEIVSFNITGRGRARCCSVAHAAAYFAELTAGDGLPVQEPDLDPFMS
jgi:hypothetical protein